MLVAPTSQAAIRAAACQLPDDAGCRNGAQGRNRTTDTAIFSRMLYQLSYLGAAGGLDEALRAPRYSQCGRACPPRFACGFARRGLALWPVGRRGKPLEINGFSRDAAQSAVGWAERPDAKRSAACPPFGPRIRTKMVGTALRAFAHPTAPVSRARCSAKRCFERDRECAPLRKGYALGCVRGASECRYHRINYPA